MFEEFSKFLTKTNAMALAVGVIIGAAVGKVVDSLVKDVLMPLIGLALPGGDWREAKLVLSQKIDGTPGGAVTSWTTSCPARPAGPCPGSRRRRARSCRPCRAGTRGRAAGAPRSGC